MQMKCEYNKFPCINVKYGTFDRICQKELKIKIDADSIVNKSDFCTIIPLNTGLTLEELETSDYLQGLRGKVGVYHLWLHFDDCDDHGKNTMLGVYVGKGFAGKRINNHIKEKFPEVDFLFVSFYECENRIAKYIEQLFLDTYKFRLNKAENCGKEPLYAVWDEDRHTLGTELYPLANTIAKRNGLKT